MSKSNRGHEQVVVIAGVCTLLLFGCSRSSSEKTDVTSKITISLPATLPAKNQNGTSDKIESLLVSDEILETAVLQVSGPDIPIPIVKLLSEEIEVAEQIKIEVARGNNVHRPTTTSGMA